jgi:hypothetical protein
VLKDQEDGVVTTFQKQSRGDQWRAAGEGDPQVGGAVRIHKEDGTFGRIGERVSCDTEGPPDFGAMMHGTNKAPLLFWL